MKTQQLLSKLYDQGIRKIEVDWRAGGDDGSIEEVRMFPHDRHPTSEEVDWLKGLAWTCYTDDYGGYTAGEFSVYGGLSIIILPNGGYTAKSYNNYSEDEYDEETDEYVDVNEQRETNDNTVLAETVGSDW